MTNTEAATLLVDSIDRVRDLNLSIRNPPAGFASKHEFVALDEASNNIHKAIKVLSGSGVNVSDIGVKS